MCSANFLFTNLIISYGFSATWSFLRAVGPSSFFSWCPRLDTPNWNGAKEIGWLKPEVQTENNQSYFFWILFILFYFLMGCIWQECLFPRLMNSKLLPVEYTAQLWVHFLLLIEVGGVQPTILLGLEPTVLLLIAGTLTNRIICLPILLSFLTSSGLESEETLDL